MEALLKLSGLLSDEDVDRTDLGTLEKKLADKTFSKNHEAASASTPPSLSLTQPGASLSPDTAAPQANKIPSPQSSSASPIPTETNKPEEEVEALSDLMCSLVTSNSGETRYIGRYLDEVKRGSNCLYFQAHHPDSRSSLRKAYSGSMRRPAIAPSRR